MKINKYVLETRNYNLPQIYVKSGCSKRFLRTKISGLELIPEATVRRCSLNKEFLKISQNSKESTCARICGAMQLY